MELTPALEAISAPPVRESAPSRPGCIDIEDEGARVRVTGAVDPATLRTILASLRGR